MADIKFYAKMWDRNKEFLDIFKKALKGMNENNDDELEISLPKNAVEEIVSTFAHYRNLEMAKQLNGGEFAEYWGGEKHEQ